MAHKKIDNAMYAIIGLVLKFITKYKNNKLIDNKKNSAQILVLLNCLRVITKNKEKTQNSKEENACIFYKKELSKNIITF
jgi:hypothetical protein